MFVSPKWSQCSTTSFWKGKYKEMKSACESVYCHNFEILVPRFVSRTFSRGTSCYSNNKGAKSPL